MPWFVLPYGTDDVEDAEVEVEDEDEDEGSHDPGSPINAPNPSIPVNATTTPLAALAALAAAIAAELATYKSYCLCINAPAASLADILIL